MGIKESDLEWDDGIGRGRRPGITQPVRKNTLVFKDYRELVPTCPNCGNSNLHHGGVTLYQRSQEDAPTVVVKVGAPGESAASPLDVRGNPSLRRDGLAIAFTCENCSLEAQLTFAQHKGETLIQWRYCVGDTESEALKNASIGT